MFTKPYAGRQEQMLYRPLSRQIQMGYCGSPGRFPTVNEVARQFRVSYCPAQRVLKALKRAGLIRNLPRKENRRPGKALPNDLQSDAFRGRTAALTDLCQSLVILSLPDLLQGMCLMHPQTAGGELPDHSSIRQWKALSQLFEQARLRRKAAKPC